MSDDEADAQMTLGIAKRDEGMLRAELAACDRWKDEVRAVIRRLASTAQAFTADDVWRAIEAPPTGTDARALGPLLRGEMLRGRLLFIGTRRTSRASRNGGYVAIWRGVGA